jgi:hypothetical protein
MELMRQNGILVHFYAVILAKRRQLFVENQIKILVSIFKTDPGRIYIKEYISYPYIPKSLFGEGYFGDIISLFLGFQSLYPISFYEGFCMFKVHI